MAWIRIENDVAFHPKILAAGNEAVGAWLRMICWSNDNLTDGTLPRAVALELARSKRVLTRLIESKLLDVAGNDYQVHDYKEYQTPARVISSRTRGISEKRSRAGRQGARKRWGRQQGEEPENANRNSLRNSVYDDTYQEENGKIIAKCQNRNFLHGKKNSKSMANGIANGIAKSWQTETDCPVNIEEPISESKISDSDCEREILSRKNSPLKNSDQASEAKIEVKPETDSRQVRAQAQKDEEFFNRNVNRNMAKSWQNNATLHSKTEILPSERMANGWPISKELNKYDKHTYLGASKEGPAVESASSPESSSGRIGAHGQVGADGLSTPGAAGIVDLVSPCQPALNPDANPSGKASACPPAGPYGGQSRQGLGQASHNRPQPNFDRIGNSTERTISLARLEETLLGYGVLPMTPKWIPRASALAPFAPDELRRALIRAFADSTSSRVSPGFIVAILERWRAEQPLSPQYPPAGSEWLEARAREAEREKPAQAAPRARPEPKPEPKPELTPEEQEAQWERNRQGLAQLLKSLEGKMDM